VTDATSTVVVALSPVVEESESESEDVDVDVDVDVDEEVVGEAAPTTAPNSSELINNALEAEVYWSFIFVKKNGSLI
jgi:hypothetical protein